MTRWVGLVCVAGALVWLAGWMGSLFTEEDTKTFLGLGEVGWRRFVSLPLLAFLALAWAAHKTRRDRSRLGAIGVRLASAGLVLMFVGNVLEVGFRGGTWIDYGWGVFILGGLLGVPGFVLLGVSLARDRGLPRASRVLAASGAVLLAIPLFSITFGLAWLLWGVALALRPPRPVRLAQES